MNEFEALFREIFHANRFYTSISDADVHAFDRLTSLLLEANQHINLTAITDLREIIVKHYADSASIASLLPENASVVDVGAGAGFPTLPLAILRRDIRFTALDSTGKKLRFIEYAAAQLQLTNLSVVHARAEEAAASAPFREQYEVAVSRAVARLNVLCELCLPFVRCGGKFFALKGASAPAEIAEAQSAIPKLGGEMTENIPATLYGGSQPQKHSVIIIQKISPTPKIYPRNFAQILKKPL